MHNPVVHFEMLSKNPAQLSSFYEKIFGWKIHDVPELNYRMVDTGAQSGINGGIMQPDRPEPWPGTMTFYTDVDDLAAYRKKIVEAGGKILIEEQEVPGMGTLSLFTDPEGRMMGLWQHAKEYHNSLMIRNASANLAVKDLGKAREFYEGKLGLRQIAAEGEDVIVFKSGSTIINVYRSQYAGTNKATAVTWVVGEHIDGVVRDLKSKGITFEHYDLPGMKREGDIHIGGDMKVAWFKDPDGNILNVVSG
jgi:predicted enzyme related to lactoylglutathione lyase